MVRIEQHLQFQFYSMKTRRVKTGGKFGAYILPDQSAVIVGDFNIGEKHCKRRKKFRVKKETERVDFFGYNIFHFLPLYSKIHHFSKKKFADKFNILLFPTLLPEHLKTPLSRHTYPLSGVCTPNLINDFEFDLGQHESK